MTTTRITSTELFKKAFKQQVKTLNTSMPGHVVAFDSSTQLAQIQPAIKLVTSSGTQKEPSIILEVPVLFAGGDQFYIEHQIDIGCEGIIIFSQRCIDEWINSGNIANNPVLRMHSIDDAYFIPGIRSQPKKISSFSNDGIKIRNAAGDKFIHLKSNGDADINVTNFNITGNLNIVGATDATGDISATGTITGTTDVIAGTISGKTHTHLTTTNPSGPPI